MSRQQKRSSPIGNYNRHAQRIMELLDELDNEDNYSLSEIVNRRLTTAREQFLACLTNDMARILCNREPENFTREELAKVFQSDKYGVRKNETTNRTLPRR